MVLIRVIPAHQGNLASIKSHSVKCLGVVGSIQSHLRMCYFLLFFVCCCCCHCCCCCCFYVDFVFLVVVSTPTLNSSINDILNTVKACKLLCLCRFFSTSLPLSFSLFFLSLCLCQSLSFSLYASPSLNISRQSIAITIAHRID